MALPKLENPKHECILPASGQKVYYRPFLVGEQKVLLIAQESEDANQQIREMIRMINVCCDDVTAEKLASIDLEYLFLQIRIKSVGETSDVMMECNKCKEENQLSINLESAETFREGEEVDHIIKLTPKISLDLYYPTYQIIQQLDANKTEDPREVFSVVAKCINAVIDGDEIHTRDDFTDKELVAFLDSMSMEMFEDIQKFFSAAPILQIKHTFVCKKCEVTNNLELKGVGSFFG